MGMSKPFVCPADMDEHGQVRLDMPRAQYLAICKARFAGKRVDVEIRERKTKRSFDQNAWMHAAFALWVQDTLPHYAVPTVKDGVERLKDELLGLVFGYHVYQSQITGEIVKSLYRPHTSTLNTAEFTEFMDVAIVEAAKTGHAIEEPKEWKERRQKAARKAKAA